MSNSSRFFALAILFLTVPALAAANGWPHLRGPEQDGRVAAGGVFDVEDLALEVAWKVPLGPAYSGIAIADGKAVTLYSDGQSDLAIAVDTATGKKLWNHKIDAVYRGHDGSSDGPLSTPLIHDGMVYVLGARGQLFALRLADGQQVWAKEVPEAFGAKEPDFGFTTTPIIEGDVLVVQVGGSEGRSILGLDRKTGRVLWSRGDDTVDYQSPTAMTLLGERQIVAVSARHITGLGAEGGEILWQFELGEQDRAGSATPVPVGEDRFLIFVSGAATVYELVQRDGGIEVVEAYRSRELGGTYALPVYHEGYLYGFRGQFLTCIKATTGERVWKSRPPGGRGLILVDGHLVIFGAKGEVVVAAATPEGYVEKARRQALDGNAYTWPSFAEGKVFVRNLEEMAAVEVMESEGFRGTEVAGGTADHHFGKFVRKLEAAAEKKALIDQFLAEQKSLPVVDGEYVHFVFRGEAEDVALEGNIIPGGGTEGLEQVAGTDFYYKTFKVEPGTRWEYRFVKNLEDSITDPHNSRTVPAYGDGGTFSELVLPGYELPEHLAEPADGDRGTVETLTFKSEMLGNEREVRVYLPPGYAEGGEAYPLLLVHGLEWSDRGLMVTALDNLLGERVEPLVVAFVAPSRAWWEEGGGTGTDAYVDMLVQEMVPFLEGKYRLDQASASRALMGDQGFALTAAYGALKHPKVFGKAALLSVHLGAGYMDQLMELLAQDKRPAVDLFLTWNRYDVRRHANGIDYRGDSRRLAEALKAHGFEFTGGEVVDAHGWGAARAVTDDVLEALFPLELSVGETASAGE